MMWLVRVFHYEPQFSHMDYIPGGSLAIAQYRQVKTLYPVIHRLAEPKAPAKKIWKTIRTKPKSGALKKPKSVPSKPKTMCGLHHNLEIYEGEPTADPIAGITLCDKCFNPTRPGSARKD